MKIFRLWIFLVLFNVPDALKAQTVEWSNQQKVKSRSNYTLVLGSNAAGYFLLRSKDNEFTRELILERYKSNLALDLSKELWQPPGSIIEKVMLQPSGLIAFGLTRNNVQDKYDFLYWKADDQLTTAGTAQTLFQVDASVIKDKHAFYIKQSTDKSKYYIMYLMKAKDGDASILAVQAFTNELAPLFSKYYPLNYPVEHVFITGFECDDSDKAFVLIDFPDSPVRKRGESQRKFFLYAISATQNDLTEFELGNDSTEIVDLGMVVNNYHQSVTVSGFYRNKTTESSLDGIFMCSIDMRTLSYRVRRSYPFDKALVQKSTSVLTNENSPGLSDLLIRKIVPRSDGGCMVIAEKSYETKQVYTYFVNGFQQTSSRTVYNYDEVMVFSLDTDGKMQFNDVIKKRQSSVNDGGYYSSFVTLNTNSSVALIYSMDASAESDIMISTISPKGEIDTRILIKAMSYYVSLMPPESRQISANSTLICAMKDRKFSIMKVTY